MQLYPIRSNVVVPGDSVATRFVEALSIAGLKVEDDDIIAIASKVVSIAENNFVSLEEIKPSNQSKRLGRKYELPSEFVQVVLDESDAIYGGVTGAILTLKNGNAIPNAGVDRKNAPAKSAIPWPVNPQLSADKIRRALKRKLGRKIGLVIVDSRVTPLRLGTIGLAIACSGFQPVRDSRGIRDMYGRKTLITLQSLADGVAAAAHLLMGETREAVPFVLVRGAPVRLDSGGRQGLMTLPIKDCLYMSQLPEARLNRQESASIPENP